MAARGKPATLAAVLRALGALAVAACLAACATETPGYAIVTQDKYDFMSCREIIAQRTALTAREKDLSAAAAKAEAAPGGFIAGTLAYSSELSSTRALLAAAHRAARKNNCDAAPK
jgi:hypothetical protein